MPRPKRTPARKAPGQNVENWQRHTVQVLLRLPPDIAALLRELAAGRGATVSGYVARLVRVADGRDPEPTSVADKGRSP